MRALRLQAMRVMISSKISMIPSCHMTTHIVCVQQQEPLHEGP